MNTIRTLEELLVSLQDTQSLKQTEAGKCSEDWWKNYVMGYAEGLEAAILLVQAAIRDEVKAEKDKESIGWGY